MPAHRNRHVSRLLGYRLYMSVRSILPAFAPLSTPTFLKPAHQPFSSNRHWYTFRRWRSCKTLKKESLGRATVPASAHAHTQAQTEQHQYPPDVTSSTVTAPFSDKQSQQIPDSSKSRPLRKGDQVVATIVRVGFGGSCIARLDKRVVPDSDSDYAELPVDDLALPVYCPPGACPGDAVQCVVTRVRRNLTRLDGRPIPPPPGGMKGLTQTQPYIEALYSALLKPSADAVPPGCPHFGHHKLGGGGCGGCSMLHMPYDMQLAQKHAQLRTVYEVLDQHDRKVPLQPIMPCRDTFEYRNKMEFSFGRRWLTSPDHHTDDEEWTGLRDAKGKHISLGLHVPQRFDKVIDISECRIQPAICNDILNEVRSAVRDMQLEPYVTNSDAGYIRNVAIRSSINAHGKQEIMIHFITSWCDEADKLVPLAKQLMQRFSNVICVIQNMRGLQGEHVMEEDCERLLAGERAYIEQQICGLTFRISALSFFQTNPQQAELLYNQIGAMAQLTSTDILLDLYCGTGTIGLSLANRVDSVYGIDVIETAINDAVVNAELNNISNAQFMQLNLDKLKQVDKTVFPDADVIVVDPPRAGLHPDVIKFFATCNARCIIYVSCNPMTQVRDIMKLMQLVPGKFKLTGVQPVDMFPNSHHVECIASLQRT